MARTGLAFLLMFLLGVPALAEDPAPPAATTPVPAPSAPPAGMTPEPRPSAANVDPDRFGSPPTDAAYGAFQALQRLELRLQAGADVLEVLPHDVGGAQRQRDGGRHGATASAGGRQGVDPKKRSSCSARRRSISRPPGSSTSS